MSEPFQLLEANLKDAEQLQQIHTDLTGTARGRRFDIDVLNRSAIVLVVAAWESLVEDVAAEAFKTMLQNATSHDVFPPKVLVVVSKPLREADDQRRVWELAGVGWKALMQAHRDQVLSEFLGGFHTPKPDKVDALFERLIGLSGLSTLWNWRQNNSQRVCQQLTRLIELRGRIAHRLTPERYVTKDEVRKAVDLVGRAAAVTQNWVNDYVESRVGQRPWHVVQYGSAK